MSLPGERRRALEKFLKGYRILALIVLNCLLLFVVLNLIVWGFGAIGRKSKSGSNPLFQKYGVEAVLHAYPDKQPDQVAQLLHETWGVPMEFDGFALFKEGPRRGTFVNVDAAGFRHGQDQGLWPVNESHLNVFVFGGSTTFGYGVADAETIPSQIQQLLQTSLPRKISVYNFGRGFYTSAQERILFEQLLINGARPHLAIFIDGLNDFYYGKEQMEFRREFSLLVQGKLEERTRWQLLQQLPLVRVIKNSDIVVGTMGAEPPPPETEGQMRETGHKVVQDYFANQNLIAAVASKFGVQVCFVFQPVPTHRCHAAQFSLDQPRHQRSKFGYQQMEHALTQHRPSDSFLYLGGMQEGVADLLYVDGVHYSPKMNSAIAQRIVQHIVGKQLLTESRRQTP